jgi:hypothetical protein
MEVHDPPSALSGSSPGWKLLSDLPTEVPPSADDFAHFFNGGEPDWRIASQSDLEPIQIASSIIERTRRRIAEKRTGIELLIGPAGEGKSTSLLQAAARILRESNNVTILWREQRDAALTDEVLAKARELGPHCLVVADNAHTLLRNLDKAIKNGAVGPSHGSQFLLASRDTDWARVVFGEGRAFDPIATWSRGRIIVADKHPFGKALQNDADRIVRNWARFERDTPPSVKGLRPRDAAAHLVAEMKSADPSTGALLGGLLAVRFTQDGLKEHLISLLDSLSQDSLPSSRSMADLLAVLAVVDVAGVGGIPREVLAKFCDLPVTALRVRVENRLAREAVASASGDQIQGRHPRISRALVEAALSTRSNLPLEEALEDVLRSTVEVRTELGSRREFGTLLRLPQKVGRITEEIVPLRISGPLAIQLARRVVSLTPNDLASHELLSICFRNANLAGNAVEEVWQPILGSLLLTDAWRDWRATVRTSCNEIATALDVSGDSFGAFAFRCLAISDKCEPANSDARQINVSLAGAALSLQKLYRLRCQEPEFLNAVRQIDAYFRKYAPQSNEARYASFNMKELKVSPVDYEGVPQLLRLLSASLNHSDLSVNRALLGEWLDSLTFNSLRSKLTKD